MTLSRLAPSNPLQVPRFGNVATFNRLPFQPDFRSGSVDVALVGVPHDGGTTYRPGARFGPRAVRDASVLNRNFNASLGVDVFKTLRVIDAGDVPTNPINLAATFRSIEETISRIHARKARHVAVGGDHSILLPELRALHKKYGEITLVHFDAHTDTADAAWGEKHHHGTPIRRAIEEGLLKGPRIFQIGIRGPLTTADQEEYSRQHKIPTLDMDAFEDRGKREAFFRKIHKVAGKGPCFLTFDVDGVDPAFAPGTGTPVVGGLTSREALTSVRRLKGLKFVGGDVVEISPAYDHAEMTSLLGAALVFEILSLMALK